MVLKFKIIIGVTFPPEKKMIDNLILDRHSMFIELLKKCHLFPSALLSNSYKKTFISCHLTFISKYLYVKYWVFNACYFHIVLHRHIPKYFFPGFKYQDAIN